MKKVINYFIVVLIIFLSDQSFAQYGNNGRRGAMNTNMPSENRAKKEPVDQVEVMTKNMTDKLNLDGFQSAIVKNIIGEYIKKVDFLYTQDIPNEAKTEKSKIAQDVMEAKLDEILNEKQKVILADLKAQGTGKKKKKKNDKEKDAVLSEE